MDLNVLPGKKWCIVPPIRLCSCHAISSQYAPTDIHGKPPPGSIQEVFWWDLWMISADFCFMGKRCCAIPNKMTIRYKQGSIAWLLCERSYFSCFHPAEISSLFLDLYLLYIYFVHCELSTSKVFLFWLRTFFFLTEWYFLQIHLDPSSPLLINCAVLHICEKKTYILELLCLGLKFAISSSSL